MLLLVQTVIPRY